MSMGSVRAGEAFIELTTRDSKLQKGLSNAQARLKAFGAASSEIGRDILSFSATGAAGFGLAFKIFKDFDSQMRMVKAVTGATGKEFDMLTAKARQIGAVTSYTAEQVAQAMTALGRMGLNPQEIDAAIMPVLNLARATGTDLAEAADIAANSLRIFGLDATKMGDVTDYLVATANGSAQTLTDLFEALKLAGPQAKTAGESIQDTAAALGVMANMGIKGSLAGTSLRKAYLQFADPKIQNFLKDYNIRTVDANGNLRKMRDIMVDLTRAMATMGSAEKLAFAKEVFDLRGMTGGLAITADTTKLDEFIQKLENCRGVANKTREDIEKGAGGAWDKMLSALQDVGITIGEIISKSMLPLMDTIANVANSFGKWISENQGLVTSLGEITATLIVVGGTLVAVSPAVKVFTAAIALAKVGVTVFHGVCAAAPALKAAWVSAMAAAQASTVAFTAATATGTSVLGAFGVAVKAFLTSNPLGWFALAAGAIAGLAIAFGDAGDAAEEYADKNEKVRAANDRERASDQAKMNRLQTLAAKQKLTNDEMVEARTLTADLESRYGKLGITFNDTAKSIGKVADALALLNKQQSAGAVCDIDAEIAEKRRNISSAEANIKDWQSVSWSDIGNLGKDYWSWGGLSNAEKAVRQNRTYIDAQRREIRKLEARRAAILSGKNPDAAPGSGNVPGTSGATGTATSYRDYLNARDQAAKMENDFSKKESSPFEIEIAEIEKTNSAYKELLQTMLQYQREKLKLMQGKNAPAAEIDALRADILNLETKLSGADAATEGRKNALRQQHSRDALAAISGDANRIGDYRKDRERKRIGRELENEMNSVLASDPEAGAGKLRELIAMYQTAAKTAADEHARLISEARRPDADGVVRYTEEEKSGIAAAFEKLKDAENMTDVWREKLRQSGETMDRRVAVSSWSAKNLNSMLGGSSADRTAAATERANILTIKTHQKLDELIAKNAEINGLTYGE